MKLFKFSVFIMISWIWGSTAFGHARWTEGGIAPPRDLVAHKDGVAVAAGDENNPKDFCGVARDELTQPVTIFAINQTVVLEWEEFINHSGHFLLSFSPANDQNFDSLLKNGNDNVVIPDTTNTGTYTHEVTLPGAACTDCTLQLIQYMSENNLRYFSCANIHLVDGAAIDEKPDNVTGVGYAGGDAQVDLSWTNPSSDFYRVIIVKHNQTITDSPADKTDYKVGDTIPGGATVVYAGAENTANIGGLENNASTVFKVYAQNPRKNYSAGEEIIATLGTPVNKAPNVTIVAKQGGTEDLTVSKQGGVVTIETSIVDPNPGDQHTLDWTETDNRLVDTDNSDTTLTFDPSLLDPDDYKVVVKVTDNGVPAESATESITVTVVDTPSDTSTDENKKEDKAFASMDLYFLFSIFMLLGLKTWSRAFKRS